MKVYFFDTHAHILGSRTAPGRGLLDVLQNATEAGVCAVLIPAVEPDDWDVLAEPRKYPGVELYIALGLHPYFVCDITSDILDQAVSLLKLRVENAAPAVRAIGECGLDFRGARGVGSSRDRQFEAFRAHLALARETGLPLSIHCVAAHGPMIDLLTEAPTPPSVLHAFSGSAEVGRTLVEHGHYLSFAGNLCLDSARKVVAAARFAPRDRIVLETDSPDQTPPRRRPAANQPAFIVDVAERLAEIRGETLADVAAYTTANARRLFGLGG